MSLPSDSSYPIADFAKLLRDRAELDLSPIELAEILWLALHKGEGITGEQWSSPSSQPKPPKDGTEPPSSPTQPQEPRESQSPKGAAVVSEPPKTSDQDQEKIQTEGTALPVNIPEAVALRNRREISRSLRPLMRKVPSKLRQEIDEAATVTHIAETQTWNPVVKPEPERWLELAIVVEVTNLLEVWRETIAELCHVMERQGAFRDVRTWQLKSNEQGKLELFLQTASGLKGSARRPKELRDFGGRRLVLLLSDCTSKAWRSGKILDLLGLWSRTNPITIVQLLPEHYWDRTALDLGYLVALSSRHPGALSRDWGVEGLSPTQRRRLPAEGLKFPVITIQPGAIGEWAKALAAIGEQRTTGIWLGLKAFQSEEAMSVAPPLTARQLVRQFRATASDRAQELADRMAVLPVNWSVIRLVQKNWQQEGVDPLQETVALPLAEIFLSGLLCREPRAAQQYDFVAGVRDVLLGAIPISEAQEVGEEVATAIFKQLSPEVQERVAEDIERRYGESLSYFEAFLIPDLPWGEEAGAEIFPFARVVGEVLRRWGGEYAALAEELKQTPLRPKLSDLAEFPPIKTFKFEVETITLEDETETPPGINLQPFEFEVALIEVNQPVLSSTDNLLEILDEEVSTKTRENLNDLQQLILKGVLANQTYEQIAAQNREDIEYLPVSIRQGSNLAKYLRNNVAPNLWKVLSEVLDEKVTKRNLKKVIEQWAESRRLTINHRSQQGQCFIEDLGNGVQLEMVAIPEGSFVMGSPEDELERRETESPQHQVTIKSFFLGKYPVTQAQWQAVASLPQVNHKLDPEPSEFKGANRPVESVSWYDAVEFCARLSQYTGKHYRLPTEAEWEYACRAVIREHSSAKSEPLTVEEWNEKYHQPFHFGETISTELANYDGDSTYGRGVKGKKRGETTTVGSFQVANAFGLYDLHGNVWEWCEDNWHENYDGAPKDGSAWLSGESEWKVLRGGSWLFEPERCRSASRNNWYARVARDLDYGFRVVGVLPRTP